MWFNLIIYVGCGGLREDVRRMLLQVKNAVSLGSCDSVCAKCS
jgi:hypothetical protein